MTSDADVKMWTRAIVSCVIAIGTCALMACGPSQEELANQARAEEWTGLQEELAALTEMRSQLASLGEKVAAGAEALELAEDADPDQALADLKAEAESLAEEISGEEGRGTEFYSRVVKFINDGVDMDAVDSPEQLEAIRMKSGEDLLIAQEYIDKGGDYKRAAEILERSLGFDTENEELKAALEHAKDYRFATDERFAQVKNGMTREEVAAILGQVFARNVREKDGNVIWAYKKEDGGGAAVFFRQTGGEWKVISKNFDAVSSGG